MVDVPRVSVLLHRIREEVAALRRMAARPRTRLDDIDAYVDTIAGHL